jgi:outer membrane murein-binding lipoprotein Lpp
MKRKRFFVLLLAAALVLSSALLAGCSSSGSSGSSGSADQVSASEQSSKDSSSTKSDKDKSKSSKSDDSKKDKDEKKSTETSKSSKSSGSSSASGSSSSGSSSSGSKKNSSSHVRTCTIYISAARLKKSSEASSDVKALVPSSGIIMSKRTVRLRSGDTVKTVLHREAGKAGISIATKGGNYVEGIAGIYEFDGGKKSGWMYSVNGTFPNVSYNKYKLKDGDDIAWRYTLDLGNDL